MEIVPCNNIARLLALIGFDLLALGLDVQLLGHIVAGIDAVAARRASMGKAKGFDEPDELVEADRATALEA